MLAHARRHLIPPSTPNNTGLAALVDRANGAPTPGESRTRHGRDTGLSRAPKRQSQHRAGIAPIRVRLDKAEVTGSSPVSSIQHTPPVSLQDQTERQRARYRAWKSGE
jgi:hypothetical protein